MDQERTYTREEIEAAETLLMLSRSEVEAPQPTSQPAPQIFFSRSAVRALQPAFQPAPQLFQRQYPQQQGNNLTLRPGAQVRNRHFSPYGSFFQRQRAQAPMGPPSRRLLPTVVHQEQRAQASTDYIPSHELAAPAPIQQQQQPDDMGAPRNPLHLPLHLRPDILVAQRPQISLPGPVNCMICGTACSSKYALAQHHADRHAANPFFCEFCGRGPYQGTTTLENHRLAHHTPKEEWKIVCTCGEVFPTTLHMRKHQREVKHEVTH